MHFDCLERFRIHWAQLCHLQSWSGMSAWCSCNQRTFVKQDERTSCPCWSVLSFSSFSDDTFQQNKKFVSTRLTCSSCTKRYTCSLTRCIQRKCSEPGRRPYSAVTLHSCSCKVWLTQTLSQFTEWLKYGIRLNASPRTIYNLLGTLLKLQKNPTLIRGKCISLRYWNVSQQSNDGQ